MRVFVILFLLIAYSQQSSAQHYRIYGKLIDASTSAPVPSAELRIMNTIFTATSDANGAFLLEDDIPPGNQVLIIEKEGYILKKLPLLLENELPVYLPIIPLEIDVSEEQAQVALIALSEQQLDADGTQADYATSGLLAASRDVFLRASAYDFSATFFRPRGLSSEHGEVLINGIKMNKLYSGRPLWANWGGLNDIQRNQVFSQGITANDYSFGNLAGTTNIIMRASQYRPGGRISYASSNRTYQGRVMASYSTGLNDKGWAFTAALARRYGNQGFVDGSLYDANSISLSVEKQLSLKHSLNFTGFYTPNRRGKTSANTEEITNLGGIKYNSYWGYQNGEVRNSRTRETKEPVFMLSHFWKPVKDTRLATTLAYQTGKIGNSRLGYDNVPNPDPSYYQKLPSYFLGYQDVPNLEKAYRATEEFEENPQIDWQRLYRINIAHDGPARYYLYEDRVDDRLYSFSSILNHKFSSHMSLDASLRLKDLRSHNFASLTDLLGATAYLDVDTFNTGAAAQSDLDNINRTVNENEIIKYNYFINAFEAEAFTQLRMTYQKVNFYFSGRLGNTTYQREGIFKNGNYPNDSQGKSETLSFVPFGVKAGGTYKVTGRHVLDFNAALLTHAPSIRNSFSNSRQNNRSVINLSEEQNTNIDLSYVYRSPFLNARLTGYLIDRAGGSEISFYYADGISGQGRNTTTAFVQEVLTNVNKRHLGFELGAEAQITPTFKLKTAAALGQFTYQNNPDLYLTSDDFEAEVSFGKAYLKNYHLAGGPQRALQLGFEYRDPEYWWLGTTANYFSHAYIDIAPLTRTRNFYQDTDGNQFTDYDPMQAREILRQERFKDFMLLNMVGGKSWRVGSYYLGFFAVVNNLLNQEYKSGGFEQGRNANYRTLSNDMQRDKPLFGPKYWQGYGTTYYLNLYLRF